MGTLILIFHSTTEKHGLINGNKPVTLSLKQHADPFGLKNSDIEGSKVGSKNRINTFNSLNYNLTNADIIGSAASTIKKGIVTDRHTNPLKPIYSMPGYKEVNSENNPYGNTLHKKADVKKIKIPSNKELTQEVHNESGKVQSSKSESKDLEKIDINKR